MSDEPLDLDLDGDGKPDLIIQKTNGNELFVSVKLLVKFGTVLVSAIAALWFGVMN